MKPRALCSDIRYVKGMQNGRQHSVTIFPKADNDGITIVNMYGTKSAWLVMAFGKTQLFSAPALSFTDFVFI